MFFKFVTIVTVMLSFPASIASLAQGTPPVRTPRTTSPNRPDPVTERWYEELRRRENAPSGVGMVETPEGRLVYWQAEARKKLGATKNDKREYAAFLKRPDTGLIRLAPTGDCSRLLDVTKPNSECLHYLLPGKGQAYSFRRHDYSHPAFADLERTPDTFVLGGTFVLGLITTLGEAPIESIDLSDSTVSALTTFMPAVATAEASKQENDLKNGLVIGGQTYRKFASIEEGATYLLRSVAFKVRLTNAPNEKGQASLDSDERRDVTVVFKVVRRDAQDTMLLLWRKLTDKESPLLEVDMNRR